MEVEIQILLDDDVQDAFLRWPYPRPVDPKGGARQLDHVDQAPITASLFWDASLVDSLYDRIVT